MPILCEAHRKSHKRRIVTNERRKFSLKNKRLYTFYDNSSRFVNSQNEDLAIKELVNITNNRHSTETNENGIQTEIQNPAFFQSSLDIIRKNQGIRMRSKSIMQESEEIKENDIEAILNSQDLNVIIDNQNKITEELQEDQQPARKSTRLIEKRQLENQTNIDEENSAFEWSPIVRELMDLNEGIYVSKREMIKSFKAEAIKRGMIVKEIFKPNDSEKFSDWNNITMSELKEKLKLHIYPVGINPPNTMYTWSPEMIKTLKPKQTRYKTKGDIINEFKRICLEKIKNDSIDDMLYIETIENLLGRKIRPLKNLYKRLNDFIIPLYITHKNKHKRAKTVEEFDTPIIEKDSKELDKDFVVSLEDNNVVKILDKYIVSKEIGYDRNLKKIMF